VHAERPAIDALLTTGAKLKGVAAQFPEVSIHALTRHRRKCLGLSATGVLAPIDDPESLQSKISLWLQRADDLYVNSGANMDLRGQRDAIAAAFRALEFRFKHEERLAEREREVLGNLNQWTEEECTRLRSYLDKAISDASKTNYATPDVRWLNVKIVLEKRPELWDSVVALAQGAQAVG
jgi:hypothetical protein